MTTPLNEGTVPAAVPADQGKPITTLAEFCAEATRLNLTAADLAPALRARPEFADCIATSTPLAAVPRETIHRLAREAGLPMSWLDAGKASAWPELERFACSIAALATSAPPEAWPEGAVFTDMEGGFYDDQGRPLSATSAPPPREPTVVELEVEVLRTYSDRMAAKFEAAQAYAYCPSSEPYRRLMQQAREAKRGLDACYEAATHPKEPTEAASVWNSMPAEARASLRHFISAALVFGAGLNDKRDPSTRALEAYDEWFALQDSRHKEPTEAIEASAEGANKTVQQERARQLVEDWHEGLPKGHYNDWCSRAAGLLLHFSDAPGMVEEPSSKGDA